MLATALQALCCTLGAALFSRLLKSKSRAKPASPRPAGAPRAGPSAATRNPTARSAGAATLSVSPQCRKTASSSWRFSWSPTCGASGDPAGGPSPVPSSCVDTVLAIAIAARQRCAVFWSSRPARKIGTAGSRNAASCLKECSRAMAPSAVSVAILTGDPPGAAEATSTMLRTHIWRCWPGTQCHVLAGTSATAVAAAARTSAFTSFSARGRWVEMTASHPASVVASCSS
mmetsp:Transcript_18084/g.57789  ORF Transcript_18084/g.57789 Transcript_18084/m.57789 type:complete len:230 (-) Transcript_18084:734-1423(-)